MQFQAGYIKGTCMDMCPDNEINLREKERLLHILEVVPGTEKDNKPRADRKKVVKSFSRSAVGKTMQNPINLRPPDVLLRTVNYLLQDVIVNSKVPWTVTYDFVMDRLRAVRQDMIIQNLPIAHSICILQPIVRFHAYASYRLCDEPLNNFDPYINKTHLQECLKRLLCMYDECDNICGRNSYSMNQIEQIRPQFEALYLVLNLGKVSALTRALSLRKELRNDSVQLAMSLSVSYSQNNFVRVCKKMKELPLLLLLVTSLHLPEIRRRAFQIMSVAYNSKYLTFPLDVIKDLFLYDNLERVVSDCKRYGLECKENGVQFVKSNFDQTKLSVQPSHLAFIDEKLENVDVPELILQA